MAGSTGAGVPLYAESVKMSPTARSLQSLVIFNVLTYFFIADDTVIVWWNGKLVRLLLPSVGLAHHKHLVIELEHGTIGDAAGKMHHNIAILLAASRCGPGFGTIEALLTRGLLDLFLDFISVKSTVGIKSYKQH